MLIFFSNNTELYISFVIKKSGEFIIGNKDCVFLIFQLTTGSVT